MDRNHHAARPIDLALTALFVLFIVASALATLGEWLHLV